MPQQKGAVIRNSAGRIVGSELTDRQKAFVSAYIRNGGNAVAAATDAGYASPRQTAWDTMQLPHIQRAIAEAIRPRLARTAHGVSGLIEAYIAAWEEAVANDPKAALALNIKELRGLLATVTEKILPPLAAEPTDKPAGHVSIEELEAKLAEAKRIASEAAKIVDASQDQEGE